MKDINDNVKFPYVIRRRLGDLRSVDSALRWEYWIDNKFQVCLFGDRIQDPREAAPNSAPTHFQTLDVNVYDIKRDESGETKTYINLVTDSRFYNYQPIKYKQHGHSDGDDMPLHVVCELIAYLHTISKLSAFW